MASGRPGATGRWRRVRLMRSVRVRITLAATLVTAVAVTAASWLLVRSVEDTQLGRLRESIDDAIDEVAAGLRAGDDPQTAVDASAFFVEVTDEEGQLVASPSHLPRGGPTPTGTGAAPGGASARARVETITRTVTGPSGSLTVSASAPIDEVARSVEAVRRALVVGLPALVALVAALAWALVGRALRPVDAMRAEVDAITASTIHRRVAEPDTDDELGRLARTMNAMLARLDAAATRQRRFVADASHELRSPLTAVRAALEVARTKGDRADWTAVADTALAHESRIEALLDDLLTLAAHDENGSAAAARPVVPVDLGALADAEARRPRRVPVHVAHPPTAATSEVPGDPDQLARLLTNLVDNADRYAASSIHIAVTPHDQAVRLTVDDDGPGIPPHERERVFERFARLDQSRARDRGGTGLGLALVRAIVTDHDGQVRIDESPTGGARITVELPAHQPAATPDPKP